TARSFGPSTIWLNGRFSHDIDGLAVGERRTIGLKKFVDEYGRTVRAGGFFATQIPDNIVLSQIEIDGRLVGLITINRTTQ
ncbi:MAG: hypothetical protein KDA28_10100, partial [Phycisphaerales bacterium]|nr:hypothetical protein [Phycisphaerales bacterium]